MSKYNSRWDKRDDDEEPRWLPFLGIILFAGVVAIGGAITALGLAAISKIRGHA